MDKEKRKSLLQMYDLLSEALTQIDNLVAQGSIDDALSLLSQLQESAVMVGTTIEGIAGEGTESVQKLEELCEQIFLFSEDIQSGKIQVSIDESPNEKTPELSNGFLAEGTGLESLSRSLNDARSVFESEFPRSKEVVFLPCSPELWDGFDALYRELSEMPEYNVSVIPIPWFDKKPSGDLDTANPHFDTATYPSHVKLTAFDKYDFAGTHPDIIYIQNAYDSSNLGGSVHPAFYADNLKNYTDELVYIPHFVLDETIANNKGQRHKLLDFLSVPNIDSINKIIIQSEGLKLAMLCLFAGEEESEYKKKLDEKISFEAFPRITAIKNTVDEQGSSNTHEIPDSWKPFILKADGTRKKVILYSNSVQALLDQSNRLPQKIKSSLEIFRSNSDDIALIWRPHPLLEEIASSLRPETASDFQALIDEYLNAGFGILDDSLDPTTAIAISDAYYGDTGSVMELFKATGRPIMIENCELCQ